MTEIQRLRAKFEIKKLYFHPTRPKPVITVTDLDLEVLNMKRPRANESPNLRSKPLTQARCDGSRNPSMRMSQMGVS